MLLILLQVIHGLHVAALFPGYIDDGGFIQSGYEGLRRLELDFNATISYVDRVTPEAQALLAALVELVSTAPDIVIAHGGQCGPAIVRAAYMFPNIPFAITQGSVTSNNLASYDVQQEDSAFLAGAAAGLLTRTGVVGHISGLRVPPGLHGRAAFAHGLTITNARASLLTVFCGTQDNPALAECVANAEAAAGADVIFTMLNAGVQGAITAARRRPALHLIGNVQDWTQADPDLFVASAVANRGFALYKAGEDLARGEVEGGVVVKMGLAFPRVVRLVLGARVPPHVHTTVAALAASIVAGELVVNLTYSGPEMAVPSQCRTAPGGRTTTTLVLTVIGGAVLLAMLAAFRFRTSRAHTPEYELVN